MGKSLFIAEKPSVAQEFAKALGIRGRRARGYLESEDAVVTWCVGHLVTMSYPDAYDPALKRWSLDTLPFLPETFLYEIIPAVKDQFEIVKELLNRSDVETIYVCTDSGREGEYIYRLVRQMANVQGKKEKRVWIDSQTEEEIRRGIAGAKDLSAYDNLAASAYLRAKEDYLMGINFSRLLTLKYGNTVASLLGEKRAVLSVGRVMTCVLGMTVRREREIRNFKKTPFYRVLAELAPEGVKISAEWRAAPGSRYEGSPRLYKENGFREKKDAEELIRRLTGEAIPPYAATVAKKEKKTEKKAPPLLFNLAELQNVCSKTMKLSPDETLKVVQELYERKLVTYPRTDARVLSTAIAKEIGKNIAGLQKIPGVRAFAEEILAEGLHRNIARTRYTDDKKITDHYAIIPTGQGTEGLGRLSEKQIKVYEKIVRRFLSIFYPPAVYEKTSLEVVCEGEHFFAGIRVRKDRGFMKVTGEWKSAKKNDGEDSEGNEEQQAALSRLRRGSQIPVNGFEIREGETSPPKRYTSGSMILAMENAGQLIEDEELRAQIKGSGIGTSATRAEILKKLVTIRYLNLNPKTQTLSPTQMGETVYDTVYVSLRSLLNPELTASWEKGLTQVAEGTISEDEYMRKLEDYIRRRTGRVLETDFSAYVAESFQRTKEFYEKSPVREKKKRSKKS